MKMLNMICGKTLRDGISNETIREIISLEKIEEFLLEKRLRWFGHIRKMDDERVLVKAKSFVLDGSKRGRMKKTWEQAIEKHKLARY